MDFKAIVRDERFMTKAATSENDTLAMASLKAVSLLPVIKSPVQCRILTVKSFLAATF